MPILWQIPCNSTSPFRKFFMRIGLYRTKRHKTFFRIAGFYRRNKVVFAGRVGTRDRERRAATANRAGPQELIPECGKPLLPTQKTAASSRHCSKSGCRCSYPLRSFKIAPVEPRPAGAFPCECIGLQCSPSNFSRTWNSGALRERVLSTGGAFNASLPFPESPQT